VGMMQTWSHPHRHYSAGKRPLAAGLVAVLAAGFASAAPPTPAAAPPASATGAVDRDESDPAGLRKWYAYGTCLVKSQSAAAEKMLASAPDSVESLIAYLKADGPAGCFKGEPKRAFKLHSNATRGAIVEALLHRDFSALGVLRGKRAAKVFDAAAVAAPLEAKGGQGRSMAFLALSECVVGLEPVKSFAMLATPVAGPEERAAFVALVPAIGDCLPPGLQLPMRAPTMRSYLAEAAYRVSVAQTGAR
jgi:hypothetical protein